MNRIFHISAAAVAALLCGCVTVSTPDPVTAPGGIWSAQHLPGKRGQGQFLTIQTGQRKVVKGAHSYSLQKP